MAELHVFTTAHITELIFHCWNKLKGFNSAVLTFLLLIRMEICQYASAALHIYHCCDCLVWTKIRFRKLHSIYYVCIQLQREKRRKKKSTTITLTLAVTEGWKKKKLFFSPSSQVFMNGLFRQKECLFSWRIKITARDGETPANWTPSVPVCRGSKTCTEIEETGDDLRRRRRKLEPMN